MFQGKNPAESSWTLSITISNLFSILFLSLSLLFFLFHFAFSPFVSLLLYSFTRRESYTSTPPPSLSSSQSHSQPLTIQVVENPFQLRFGTIRTCVSHCRYKIVTERRSKEWMKKPLCYSTLWKELINLIHLVKRLTCDSIQYNLSIHNIYLFTTYIYPQHISIHLTHIDTRTLSLKLSWRVK